LELSGERSLKAFYQRATEPDTMLQAERRTLAEKRAALELWAGYIEKLVAFVE
jgi:hypothetical protein